MATANIKAVITAEDNASRVVDNFGKGVNKTSAGIGIAVAAMGTAAVAFGVSSVKAFAESERAGKQLDAVLRSTGGSAGVTREAAIELSQSLMKLTAIDDDAILSAENMLLTFTSVGKDAFPDATKAILDTATAMNGGLKPGAEEMTAITKQLGKALQDPDAGLGALKRVGVNVEELQQKFTDSMPIQEKQKLILQELGKEFGGSADATGTFGDKLALLQVNFGNLQEKIGGLIANAMTPLLDKINNWIEKNPELTEKLLLLGLGLGALTVALWGVNTVVNILSTSIGLLNGVMNTAFGRFGILLGAIVGVYYWFKTLAAGVDWGSNMIANFNQNLLNSIGSVQQAGGWIGRLAGYYLSLTQAVYSAARAIDDLIHKIPIIGSILPRLPQLSFPGRAIGGPVASNTPYMVGERGPELFVPRSNGDIIPNNQLSGASSGGQTTININVGLMTGSAIERRDAAMKMFEDLQDIAGQRGQTVGQLIGV